MAKKEVQRLPQVVIFVEGETDEVLFKALVEYYKGVSKKELRPCKICNLRGVTRYSGKLLAKLKNEILPDARKGGYQVQAVCCSYDTDVFEVRNPLIVDWEGLRKTVNRMGIADFIRLGIKSSIEDWILCDLEGVCRFLKLKTVPKGLKGADGCAKLNDLFAKAKRVYQKGYQAKGLVEALDMAAIRKCNKEVLKPLEAALGVEWDKL